MEGILCYKYKKESTGKFIGRNYYQLRKNRLGRKNGDWIVYQHISPNGKSYIGITQQDPEKRWQNGKGYTGQKKFYNAIKKYGWDSF